MTAKARNAYIPVIPPNPTPWEVRGPFGGVRGTKKRDAQPEYCDIVDRWGNFVMQYLNPNTARMIVDAVNHFHQPASEARRTAGEPGANTETQALATWERESPARGHRQPNQPPRPTGERSTSGDGGQRPRLLKERSET